MKSYKLLKPAQWNNELWKNGGGTTVQLAIGSDLSSPNLQARSVANLDFNWRISLATVSQSGSFSRFTGFDRALVQIDGGKLELGHSESTRFRTLKLYKPHFFAGEWPVQCRLTGDSARDVNVMVRRFWGKLDLNVLNVSPAQEETFTSNASLIHIFNLTEKTYVTQNDQKFSLGPEDLLSIENRFSDDEDIAPPRSPLLQNEAEPPRAIIKFSTLFENSKVIVIEISPLQRAQA